MKHVIFTLSLGLLILTACGKEPATSTKSRSSNPAVVSNACSSHAVGESFEAADGCNTCSCRSNGSMMCSQIACVPDSLVMQAGIIR